MAGKIEWTDATWNPIRGCSRVSHGCENCYAERMAHRFSGKGQPYEGLTRQTKHGPVWTGKITLVEKALDLPLRWREPKRIFVNSMSDLFHENVPDDFIDRVFAVMALAPKHTFQILTKRAERMHEYINGLRKRSEGRYFMPALFGHAAALAKEAGDERARDCFNIAANKYAGWDTWPLPNVHPGISVEDQETADYRIPYLLNTPAAIRWISAEPLLEPIDLTTIAAAKIAGGRFGQDVLNQKYQSIDWVVVGGESGPGARPFNVQWAREIVAQCKDYGVPCFVKQLGSRPMTPELTHWKAPVELLADSSGYWLKLRDKKGGDMSEWSPDLRVREYPNA